MIALNVAWVKARSPSRHGSAKANAVAVVTSPLRSLTRIGQFLNEFYKKGCQEKSSASTGGDLFSRSSPLCFVISEAVWRVVPFS